jgi:hypothetical protein
VSGLAVPHGKSALWLATTVKKLAHLKEENGSHLHIFKNGIHRGDKATAGDFLRLLQVFLRNG